VVHRVSGPAADLLRQVLATGGAPAALQDDDITAGLVAAGVLVAADAPDLVSRRSFVSAAAAVGAIGIVTLALPRAAAASSAEVFVPATNPDGSFVTARNDFTGTTYFAGAPNQIGVFWVQSNGAFNYQVVISQVNGLNGPVIKELLRTTLPSVTNTSSATILSPTGWTVGQRIRIEFFTIGLSNNVTGNAFEQDHA